MCKFFSFCSFGRKYYFFDWKQRQELLKSNPQDLNPDSHASIAEFFSIPEDKSNKFEYNFLTGEFLVDQINGKDNSAAAEKWMKKLDSKTIIEPLIVKKIINPFRDFDRTDVTQDEIDLLKQWASVRASVRASFGASVGASVRASFGASVWDSVRDSVWDSVWDSVRASFGASIWDSVWNSVWDSVRDSVGYSVWAYISSFFAIQYKHDFSSCVKLWESGLVPSFDGKTWRLHGEKDAKSLYEMAKSDSK
jgi:hypothetical protein